MEEERAFCDGHNHMYIAVCPKELLRIVYGVLYTDRRDDLPACIGDEVDECYNYILSVCLVLCMYLVPTCV